MVHIDKAEELISRDERMFLANVVLQHPAPSAEGVFEHGIVSLAEPEQRCGAEPGNSRHLMCINGQRVAEADYSSLTLSTVTKLFAVVRVEGHKDISNIIENINFFSFIFHRCWPKKRVRDEQVGLLDHILSCLLYNLPQVPL